MSMVGEFPGIAQAKKRLIRAPVNPMDKSTVVSIYPKKISERYITIQPGIFEIQPGTLQNPAVLVVGPSSWWKEIDDNQPSLEIPVNSVQIANSIVTDYCNGLLGCNMGDKMPGLFFLPGVWDAAKVIKEHPAMLAKYAQTQKTWFLELVRIADTLWSGSNGNPRTISDDARLACRELNITEKPWLGDMKTAELVRCIACGNLRNQSYPVCPTCKAVADPELAKKLNLQFVQ